MWRPYLELPLNRQMTAGCANLNHTHNIILLLLLLSSLCPERERVLPLSHLEGSSLAGPAWRGERWLWCWPFTLPTSSWLMPLPSPTGVFFFLCREIPGVNFCRWTDHADWLTASIVPFWARKKPLPRALQLLIHAWLVQCVCVSIAVPNFSSCVWLCTHLITGLLSCLAFVLFFPCPDTLFHVVETVVCLWM